MKPSRVKSSPRSPPARPGLYHNAHNKKRSPNLFCIVDFNLRPLLDKFGVLLQVLDPPLCVLLQVVKLILQRGEEEREKGHLIRSDVTRSCL